MEPIRRTALAAAIVAAAATGMSGCLGTGEKATASQPAGKGDGRAANPAKALAKGTFPSEVAPGATVDIALDALKADGRRARLSVTMTPHVRGSSERLTPNQQNDSSSHNETLIDPVNLKRYVVVKDSAWQDVQNNDVTTNLTNERPNALSYTFAAPPQGVNQVDVQIGLWPTFPRVPVAR